VLSTCTTLSSHSYDPSRPELLWYVSNAGEVSQNFLRVYKFTYHLGHHIRSLVLSVRVSKPQRCNVVRACVGRAWPVNLWWMRWPT